jgi:hypothetical protein
MSSVQLSGPCNSTIFTTCCHTAITERESNCPKCDDWIFPDSEDRTYSEADRRRLRWYEAYGSSKNKGGEL